MQTKTKLALAISMIASCATAGATGNHGGWGGHHGNDTTVIENTTIVQDGDEYCVQDHVVATAYPHYTAGDRLYVTAEEDGWFDVCFDNYGECNTFKGKGPGEYILWAGPQREGTFPVWIKDYNEGVLSSAFEFPCRDEDGNIIR